MNCQDARERIHDYLDLRLSGRESRDLEDHLSCCQECQELDRQYRELSGLLGGRLGLSPAAEERLLKQVLQRGRLTWNGRVAELIDHIFTFFRDLDWSLVWSKMVALPVTLAFFSVIMLHFSPVRIQELSYAVISSREPPVRPPRPMVIKQVRARQNESQLELLIDTAWRIPYEDSLSLVAEITPEGNAEIDDILEYPKSNELLDAVELNLRTSRFHSVSSLNRTFLIYSFQKIDVYERERGL